MSETTTILVIVLVLVVFPVGFVYYLVRSSEKRHRDQRPRLRLKGRVIGWFQWYQAQLCLLNAQGCADTERAGGDLSNAIGHCANGIDWIARVGQPHPGQRGSAAPCGTMGQGNAGLLVPWMVPDFTVGMSSLSRLTPPFPPVAFPCLRNAHSARMKTRWPTRSSRPSLGRGRAPSHQGSGRRTQRR
jgi:hypothetical protein